MKIKAKDIKVRRIDHRKIIDHRTSNQRFRDFRDGFCKMLVEVAKECYEKGALGRKEE